jgi:hypothetical protein
MNETRCEECGAPVEDDQLICYWCAQRNQENEMLGEMHACRARIWEMDHE